MPFILIYVFPRHTAPAPAAARRDRHHAKPTRRAAWAATTIGQGARCAPPQTSATSGDDATVPGAPPPVDTRPPARRLPRTVATAPRRRRCARVGCADEERGPA